MKIRINEQHEIEHKNGYWIYHIISKAKKGDDYYIKTKTHAKLLDMHHFAKLDGFNGEDIMKASQQLLDEAGKSAGRWVIAERKKKLNKGKK